MAKLTLSMTDSSNNSRVLSTDMKLRHNPVFITFLTKVLKKSIKKNNKIRICKKHFVGVPERKKLRILSK